MKFEATYFGKNIIDFWERYKNDLFYNDTRFIHASRQDAFCYYKKNPVIPNRKMENYQNTDLTEAFNNDYFYYSKLPNLVISKEELFTCDVPKLDTYTALLLNGWYLPQQGEELTVLPSGIIYGSLLAAAEKYPDLLKKYSISYEGKEEPLMPKGWWVFDICQVSTLYPDQLSLRESEKTPCSKSPLHQVL